MASRTLKNVDSIRRQVLKAVDRQKPGSALDVSSSRDEIERLLGEVDDFLPEWRRLPSLFRIARIETDSGIVPFSENLVLPETKHDLNLLIAMLNYLREQKGLGAVRMPLFLHPDEISLAMRQPAQCTCDEEAGLAARKRSLARLGRRGSKRWLRIGRKVFDRDDWKCQRCGSDQDLHVHRVNAALRDGNPAAYVTLCRRCHRTEDGAVTPSAVRLRYALDDDARLDQAIRSQLALVFQKGRLDWVGVVSGKNYSLLES
jgi:hypothetical protein